MPKPTLEDLIDELFAEGIRGTDFELMVLLHRMGDSDNEGFTDPIKVDDIREELGLRSKATVSAAIRRMRDRKCLEIQRDGNRECSYRVSVPQKTPEKPKVAKKAPQIRRKTRNIRLRALEK